MPVSNTLKVLDQRFCDNLISNRSMMINFVTVDENIITLCDEKKIITGDNLSKLKNSRTNEVKIDCIIESLQMKKFKYFEDFCEILVLSGYSIIAEILNGTTLPQVSVDLNDIWEEIPNLKKTLIQKEKDLLFQYINNKIREENIKNLLSQPKETQRKTSLARLSQVEQSWKFQREIKSKEVEKDQLKTQLTTIETKLIEKQKELNLIIEEHKKRKQKQEEELVIAAKFNTANDKEIQRIERSLNLFKNMVSKMSSKIRTILQSSTDSYSILIRESSESYVKKFDIDKQLEVFEKLIETLVNLYSNLMEEMKLFENLKAEVQSVKQRFQTNFNSDSTADLTTVMGNYEIAVNKKIGQLYAQIENQESFIFGILSPENIPEKYKHIQIASSERNEFLDIINELKRKIQYLESMVATKEKELKNLSQSKYKTNTIIEIIQEETNETNQKPETDIFSSEKDSKPNYQRVLPNIPFSYSSKHTKRAPNNNLNHKPKKTNFLKANVVSFI